MDGDQHGTTSRDASNWAPRVDRLTVPDAVSRYGYNLDGRRVAGPQQGFGRLWQRTYTVGLGGAVTPESVVSDWRAHFSEYWPKMGHFHSALATIQPGDVAPLTSGGVAMGVMVLYADDTSFTFLTPEGHLFAGLITFSAQRGDDGDTVAQIRILIRTADPLVEAMWIVARRGEDYFWSTTLRNVAAANGVHPAVVDEHTECVDRRRLWHNWRNVGNNPGIRSALHAVGVRPRRNATTG